MGIVLLFTLLYIAWAWKIETSQSVTCTALLSQPKRMTGYIEVWLKEQHPIEPSFSGVVYVYSTDERDLGLTGTRLLQSAGRNYGATIVEIPLILDAVNRAIHATDWQKFGLIAERGLHRWFPFDSSSFAFTVTMNPPMHFNAVRITNRVPGFICDCSQIAVGGSSDGVMTIRFILRRSPLIQVFALILCVASIIFAVAIILLPTKEGFATATASFFFSVWSLRQLISSSIHVFPTLFDLLILSVCTLLVVALCWRVIAGRVGKTDDDGQSA
ncbi:MAG: hypothetical protein ABSC55_28615 [Syntrophorhabdales bacterium]|jgi:hypothetical protein